MRLTILHLVLLNGCVTTSAAQFDSIARDVNGRVGACAVLLETGERLELNANDRFPMQSVYKIAIAMAVLHEVDQGKLKLEDVIAIQRDDYVPQTMHSPLRELTHGEATNVELRELILLAVSESDGSASDVLLRLAGSFDGAMRFLHEISVRDVTVATTENEMGRDERAQYRSWATPRGIVSLLLAIHEGRGVSTDGRALLLKCMTETSTGPNRLRAMLPAGIVIAHKTGTSRTIDGFAAATNDAGIITLPDGRHLAVVVFVSDSRADIAAREGVIARIARDAYDHFNNQERRT